MFVVKNRELSVLAIRILALYCFVQAFITLGSLVTTVSIINESHHGDFFRSIILPMILYPALWLIAGMSLWYVAKPLSHGICGYDYGAQECSLTMTLRDAYGLGFTLVGLFVLTQSIPDLISTVYMNYGDMSQGNNRVNIFHHRVFIVAVVKIMIGLCLIIGRGKLVELVLKVRGGQRN